MYSQLWLSLSKQSSSVPQVPISSRTNARRSPPVATRPNPTPMTSSPALLVTSALIQHNFPKSAELVSSPLHPTTAQDISNVPRFPLVATRTRLVRTTLRCAQTDTSALIHHCHLCHAPTVCSPPPHHSAFITTNATRRIHNSSNHP